MKERLLNNFSLKILSIFLAFFVWLVVVNVSNPDVTRTKDVTVEVKNEEILTSANKTYEIVGKDTVTISYKVRTKDAALISASDFHAYIDLAELYDVTGSVPVKIEVSADKEYLIDSPAAKPGVLRVSTEDMQRKRFELSVSTRGETEEGYAPGDVLLSPEYVYVNGPVSQVGRLSYAGIEIDVEGASGDLSGRAPVVFYDANGNKTGLGDRTTVGREEIVYKMTILKVKNVSLNFEVQGDVAAGYRFTGVESDKKTIPVAGLKSVLASLSSLTISDEDLSIEGATQDREVTVDLERHLPENVTIAGDAGGTAKVTLKVEPLKQKVFTLALADIERTGETESYAYQFDKDEVEVTVEGLEEDLESLDTASLNARLDVSSMAPGRHPGKLSFSVGRGFEVTGFSEFEVTVTSEEESAEQTEPETGTSKAQGTESESSSQEGDT